MSKTTQIVWELLDDNTLDSLREMAINQFGCGRDGIHGPAHWESVYQNGMLLCRLMPLAHPRIVGAFAFLHDACRKDDGQDPYHGIRAATWLTEWWMKTEIQRRCKLSDGMFQCLVAAIAGHSFGYRVGEQRTGMEHSNGKLWSLDQTVAICWDADRLDIGRCGVIVDQEFLSTSEAIRVAR